MRIYMNTLRKYWIAILLATIIPIYFLPCLMYASDKLGLDVVNTKETLGVTIKFNTNWYPLVSSDTLFGKLIISSGVPPTVIYCENNWINPWGCDQVWVSRYNVQNDMSKSNMFATIQQYPWGTVGIVKGEVTKTPSRELGLVQGVGIGFSGINLNILNDVKAINVAR